MGFQELLATADEAVKKHLGGDITYAPGVGSPVTVKGIFDAAYQRADAGEPGVASSGPAVFLTLADLPSDPETDADVVVTVGGTAYRPAGPGEKDGQGGVLIRLHEAE